MIVIKYGFNYNSDHIPWKRIFATGIREIFYTYKLAQNMLLCLSNVPYFR
jgi:hypothetical protein